VPVYEFQFQVVWNNLGFLLTGLKYTFLITGFSIIGAMIVGLLAALLRLSKLPVVSQIIRFYIDFFRGTPVLIQLIWIYYALPIITGISLSAVTSAVLTLSLNMGAFLAEIFRAGIQSIDKGQREAAFVLGLTYGQTMRRIILPQALARMLPPIGSSMIIILKDSSLASFIAVDELLYQGYVLQSSTFRPLEILTVVALIYFVLTYPLTILVEQLERRSGVRERH
jgi:polar amino acid transport system permease protein